VYRTCKISRTHGAVVAEPHKWRKETLRALSYLHNCEENQHSFSTLLALLNKNQPVLFMTDLGPWMQNMFSIFLHKNSYKMLQARQEKREAYQVFIFSCIASWLVVSTPLNNISHLMSLGIMLPDIRKNNIHVLNHQPGMGCKPVFWQTKIGKFGK